MTDEILRDRQGHGFRMARIDCPICGPGPERPVGLRGGETQRYGLGVPTQIVACRTCGLLYPNPFPFPTEPQTLYGDPDKYFAAHDLERKLDRYRALVRELKARSGRDNPRILDIGAGRGDFLEAARREGCSDLLGLEFSQAMIDFARDEFGVTLIAEPAEALVARGEPPFDAIVLNAVLEHVYDPDALIRDARSLCRPGSILYVDVPREPHLLALAGRAFERLRGRDLSYSLQPTWPPYHVFGFNPRSLGKLLAKHGFRVESLTVHADPRLSTDGTWRDRARGFVGEQLNRLGNVTGLAANMYVWARSSG